MTDCPECDAELEEREVAVEGADSTVTSYQCPDCDHFQFDQESSKAVLEELASPLQIRQKVVKLSGERLGIYFSNDVVRSLDIQKGEYVYVSAPDENHLVLEFRDD